MSKANRIKTEKAEANIPDYKFMASDINLLRQIVRDSITVNASNRATVTDLIGWEAEFIKKMEGANLEMMQYDKMKKTVKK